MMKRKFMRWEVFLMTQATAAERVAAFPSLADLHTWAEALDGIQTGLAPLFAHAEPRQRMLAYLTGLLRATERKNGRQPNWPGRGSYMACSVCSARPIGTPTPCAT